MTDWMWCFEEPKEAAKRMDELYAALQTARAIIRGEQLEHAVVDLERPEVGLGAYLDSVLGV
jgi:hypothetical protein